MSTNIKRRLLLLGLAFVAGCDEGDGVNGAGDDAANNPCGLTGVQFEAGFVVVSSSNALAAPFSGDFQFINNNVFSFQQASVQRKFVILIPNLSPAIYDLSTTYMSYTEKTSDTDPHPKVWKATAGTLQVLSCGSGGTALRSSVAGGGQGASATFEPVVASNNTATGTLLVTAGAHL